MKIGALPKLKQIEKISCFAVSFIALFREFNSQIYGVKSHVESLQYIILLSVLCFDLHFGRIVHKCCLL